MRLFLGVLIGLVALLSAPRANADDMLATMKVGGLKLASTGDIAMVSKDLRISMGEVRVRYEFRNLTDRDVVATVAFPLPSIDMGDADGMSLAGLRNENHDSVGFRLWIGGKPAKAELHVSTIADGRDVKALLDRYDIPYSPYHPEFGKRWSALSSEAVAVLVREGAAEIAGRSKSAKPRWQFSATYRWQQRFPAGATVAIEHAYTPLVSTAFVRYRAGDDLRFLRQDDCVDAATRAAIQSRLKEMPKAADGSGIAWLWHADYVLTTARSWTGPIGKLRLTVEAGSAGNLAALCEGRAPPNDVREIKPGTYVVERERHLPASDLRIMVIAFPGTPVERFPPNGLPP